LSLLLLALALGAALPGFPRDAGGRIAQAPLAITLDGAPAIVVVAGDRLAGFRADGATVPGLPLALGPGEDAAGPPAAADLDGDRRPEIAVVTRSGKLLLWSGRLLPGFPAALGAPASAGPSFADVDGDGRPEVVVGDAEGRLHAFERSGAEAHGFPVQVARAAVTSTVSSAVVDGARTLAFGCEDGRVRAVDPSGAARPGFPLETGFAVTGAPAFADLDGDGEIDLVAASQDFKLYAVSGRGTPLPGFPVAAGYRIYEGAAIADLDGDGRLDAIFTAADGLVHAVDGTGRPLAGFPARVAARIFAAPVVGDLDGDGALEIAVVAADGTLAVLDRRGRPVPALGAALAGGEATAAPALLELAGGDLAVVAGAPGGKVHVLRAPRRAAARTRPAAPWPQPGRDAARTARSGPNPPRYVDLELAPASPRVTDALRAGWRGVWLDAAPGEGAPAPRLGWRRDGKPVPSLDGRRELPAGTARKGETWRFVLAPPGGGAPVESPAVKVLDTPPGAPEIALVPAVPSRAAPVRVVVKRPAPDADGDRVSYRMAWLLDGLPAGGASDTLPPEAMRKGAIVTARVVATDGDEEGPPVTASARVADTAPGAIAAAAALPAATGASPPAVRLERPARDPDGDAVVYRYRWKVDGRELNVPYSTAELPQGAARKHQKVEVDVRTFDGRNEGPPLRRESVVKNSPPGAARVEIQPASPRRGDALRAVLSAPAADADGDPLRYRFAWTKNGAPLAVAGEGREVPGSAVARGDRFEVTAIASDGEADGPAARAAAVVGNTPPEPPRIAIAPERPRGGEPLRLVVVAPARDADGDPVKLEVAWARDGRATGGTGETLPPAAFAKHERVRVTVTPRDGREAGPPAAAEVRVANAPPDAPAIALVPQRPTAVAPLRVAVTRQAADPDGDAIRYRYRWLRDGAPVALEGPEVPAAELRKGQVWQVEVRPFDGETTGPLARASARVANAPPPAPEIAFAPERPRRVDGIGLALRQPPDPDGDPVTYRYAWTRNGARVAAPPEQGQIGRGLPRRGERWAVEVVAGDGEAESAPARAEAVIADTAPGAAGLALCDGPVRAGAAPEVRVASPSADPDGDPVSYRFAWTVGGKPLSAAAGPRLPASALRKHDVARVTVTPTDGELTGPPVVAECGVENTPPGAPVAVLEPAEPTAASGLAVRIASPAADRDGDPVTYRYAWTRDGLPAGLEGAAAAPGSLRHREVWRVEVIPFDGEEEGERVVLSATVRNTPPPVPEVAIHREGPGVGEPLACDARAAPRDADGEAIALRYRWLRDGAPVALGDGAAVLPAGVVRRDERWRCEAWASDGAADGARAFAEVVIADTPPGAPGVVVEPEGPGTGDDLVCRLASPSRDPDGDPVRYAYAWTRDGAVAAPGPDPTRVEASRTSRGERWRCVVTPTDGTMAGTSGEDGQVIANGSPGVARVRLEPAAPRAGEPLRCVVAEESADPDGDPVRYRFTWTRNGARQGFAETSPEVPGRILEAGDRWRCLAVPTDGELDGPEAGSDEVKVAPAAPGPPAVGRAGG
jgi:hypothetical protein